MALDNVYITILAGGSGTRLWPLSRKGTPKQLLNLTGASSMLQQTVQRVAPLVPLERVFVLTGPEHAPLIAAQLPALPANNIWVEPAPRGTAPCLGLAALKLRQLDSSPQAVMISLHADHRIVQEERFRQALRAAVQTARDGHIVTIGIVPGYAETGFGYIQRDDLLARTFGQEVYQVRRFTEKPGAAEAQEYVASGAYYWNTGYFTWTLERILGEFQRSLPVMYGQLAAIAASPGEELAQRLWEQIRPETIDVGIMERARRVAVIPCDLGWNDVGSWASLYDILPHDAAGNVIMGTGQHVGLQTTNSLVSSAGLLVATIGLEDMVVVATSDAVLILPRARAQEVSALVRELRSRKLDEFL
jgi:mannose-1-phosphate guanylyltransferase